VKRNREEGCSLIVVVSGISLNSVLDVAVDDEVEFVTGETASETGSCPCFPFLLSPARRTAKAWIAASVLLAHKLIGKDGVIALLGCAGILSDHRLQLASRHTRESFENCAKRTPSALELPAHFSSSPQEFLGVTKIRQKDSRLVKTAEPSDETSNAFCHARKRSNQLIEGLLALWRL
jgi:hypothetical protein